MGLITLHLNKKFHPTLLNRSSIFDMTDENTKEVGRRLQRLRKLKRLRGSGGVVSAASVGGTTGGGEVTTPGVGGGVEGSVLEGKEGKRNEVEKRILTWRQELMKDEPRFVVSLLH